MKWKIEMKYISLQKYIKPLDNDSEFPYICISSLIKQGHENMRFYGAENKSKKATFVIEGLSRGWNKSEKKASRKASRFNAKLSVKGE